MKKLKYKEIEFECRCVMGKSCDSLSVKDFGDNEAMFDVKRKKKFYGVVLNKKDIEKLIKFLEKVIKYKKK